MGEIRGVDVLIMKDGSAIAGQRDCSLNISGDDIDTSVKTNQGWKTSLTGLKGWSVNLDCVNYEGDGSASQRAIRKAAINNTNLDVVFALGDEEVYLGEVAISGLDLSGPMNDVSMSSFTLNGASALSAEFAPEFSSLALTGINTIATITFDETVVSNVADDAALKAAVTFAADGSTYAALAAADTVAITDGKLVVTFNSAVSGATNKIKIAASALKTTNGAIQTQAVETDAFAAA